MLQNTRLATRLLAAVFVIATLRAADPDRDFSGKWLLNTEHSDLRALTGEAYAVLVIEQRTDLHCTATTADGKSIDWTYRLDGGDSKYKIAGESMNSVAKWEGAALLVNTLVSGPRDYSIADRWTLSRDHTQINIRRQVSSGPQEQEGYLIYRREGAAGGPPSSMGTAAVEPAATGQAALVRRPEAPGSPAPAQFTVPAGTHILLSLTNPVSTKNARDGDHVYLQTAVPVAENGRIVIPRGSYVQGSVSKAKSAGRGASKGELYIRFDSLTLPNGINRDFHARLSSADSEKGNVDPDEGKITGNSKGADPGKVGRDVGLGSAGGVILGSAVGHPIAGLGAGAAAGVAAVLLSKNQDVVLPRGTSVEMVLDRDLFYTAEELKR